MKAKVFKYKSDGNTVVASYMELEPYAKNVYLSLSRKNEDGNEDDDCFHVVCRIENVYFSSEERRVQEEQHQRLLNEQKEKFLDGERITGEMFVEITGRDGFDIHIRTKGTFNRHVRGIDRNGTVSFRKIKGCRTPDFTGCHKAVSAYLAFITEKEGK